MDEPDTSSPDEASATDQAKSSQKDDHTRILKIMGALLLISTALGWGSIPLYRLVCKAVDPGGSSWQNGATDRYENVQVDKSRTVRVRFTSEVNRRLPWKFGPTDPALEVHPGEKRLTKFVATNLDQGRTITGKAVYDINPPQAGQYFKKIECFCFTQQTLEAGEKVDMPLYFWFEPDLPEHIDEVTIAYTFFNADKSRSKPTQTARK